MSGIYIPEVKFPPKPWSNMLIIVLDGDKGTAQFTLAENLEKVEVPFTIVPDHGDLIDAHKVLQEIIQYDFKTYCDYEAVFDIIDNAPTIVPADRINKENENRKC